MKQGGEFSISEILDKEALQELRGFLASYDEFSVDVSVINVPAEDKREARLILRSPKTLDSFYLLLKEQ